MLKIDNLVQGLTSLYLLLKPFEFAQNMKSDLLACD